MSPKASTSFAPERPTGADADLYARPVGEFAGHGSGAGLGNQMAAGFKTAGSLAAGVTSKTIQAVTLGNVDLKMGSLSIGGDWETNPEKRKKFLREGVRSRLSSPPEYNRRAVEYAVSL